MIGNGFWGRKKVNKRRQIMNKTDGLGRTGIYILRKDVNTNYVSDAGTDNARMQKHPASTLVLKFEFLKSPC